MIIENLSALADLWMQMQIQQAEADQAEATPPQDDSCGVAEAPRDQ